MADLKIVITALNKASGDLNKLKQDMTGVKDAGADSGGVVETFGGKIEGMMGKAAMAAGIVAGVGLAMKQIYDIVAEAAELDYAAARFDNLAASIGTTSDALMTDLKFATDGMMSDAELVASASDLMALGLADTHEEVVRLTSVAGALGMNMNQLVLALTNQTTARFDQLGVSVVGFDDKVKALEASGMSANEAFSEAFLQQAEEQILKVGSASDYAIGDVKRFESSIQNVGDAAKGALLPVATDVLPKLTAGLNNMNRVQQWKEMSAAFEDFGINIDGLTEPYERLFGAFTKVDDELLGQMDAVSQWANVTYESFVKSGMGADEAKEKVANMYNTFGNAVLASEDWADSNYESMAAVDAHSEAVDDLTGSTDEMAEAATKAAEEQAKLQEQFDKVLSLDSNYRTIMSLAVKYTEELDNITAAEVQIAELEPFTEVGGYIDGVWQSAEEVRAKIKELEGTVGDAEAAMAQMANQMALDMFATSIAIGGVTDGEMQAYLAMAVDMGLISQEAANQTMQAWLDAKANVEGNPINAEFKVDDSKVRNWQPPTKTGTVNYQIGYMPVNPNERAVGGAVYGGNPYTWQEYGYKGELFVPSSDGFVMSRADAERALSKALTGGGAAMDPDAIGKAVAKALSGVTKGNQSGNVYNLTMPTSSNPADVRTAFELMEAWA